MDISCVEDVVRLLNTSGLVFGFVGSLSLAFLTKVFITIKPDGTQSWGPNGMSNDTWLKRNIRFRNIQRFGIPAAYMSLGIGFLLQLVALWLPSLE